MSPAAPVRHRWWRIALIVLVALALLLAAGYAALLRAFPPQRLSALLADEVRAATGREFRIAGGLSLRLLPTIAVVAEDVSLGNAPWGTRAQMATLKRAAFEVAVAPLLRGQLHVLSVDVDGADVLLETDARGRPNWVFGDAPKPAAEPASQKAAPIDLDRLAIADSRLTYRSGLARETRTVAVESLTIVAERERTRLSARFAGEHRAWRLDGTTGPYAALLQGGTGWPFDVQLLADGARLSAKGSLDATGAVSAALSARIDKAAALVPLLADAAALPMPIDASAKVRRDDQALTADALALSLAGQRLKGRVTLRTERGAPRLDVDIAATSIDLAQWGVRKPAAAPASAARQPLFGDTPLPAITLPATAVHARVRVDRLAAPGLPTLSAVQAQLRVEPDRLVVEPLSLALADGQLRGRFELGARSGEPLRARLRAEAGALSLRALDDALRGGGHLQGGRADLRIDLEAAGRKPSELAASAHGSVLLSVSDATVSGGAAVMERSLVVALLQALLPKQDAAAQALHIQCAVVHLPLRNGVAAIDRTIAMETDKIAVAASGELNLAAQTVTLGFHPVVKKGIGLDSASLAKLVRLEGPLHDPQIGIDMMGTAREAATIGAAVATAGLTLVGKRLLSGPEETQVCKRALGAAKP